MLILTCPAQLQRLEGVLRRSLPIALPAYGAVLNINRGNPGGFEVAVDTWPEFGALLTRRREEVAAGDVGGTGRGHGVGTRNWRCWGHWEVLVEGTGGAGGHCRQELGYWGYWLAPGVRVGSLSPSHLDLLNETWAYGGNARSRRYLEEVLGRYPHLCLQDGDGTPLCWVLSDPFGAGSHGYTVPAQRRRGLMVAALVLTARRAHARGFPVFG
ncbi:GLYL3 protein, partial [Syrrhaptes paradoxus]|nr:GLYL3 protein [Syrrhaptes paradoxus]